MRCYVSVWYDICVSCVKKVGMRNTVIHTVAVGIAEFSEATLSPLGRVVTWVSGTFRRVCDAVCAERLAKSDPWKTTEDYLKSLHMGNYNHLMPTSIQSSVINYSICKEERLSWNSEANTS